MEKSTPEIERKKAIVKLVRATYLQPDQLDVLIDTFGKQAPFMGRTLKNKDDLARAKEHVTSEEFIAEAAPSFDALSVEELNAIADFHNSPAMLKYRMAAKLFPPFFGALQEAFWEPR